MRRIPLDAADEVVRRRLHEGGHFYRRWSTPDGALLEPVMIDLARDAGDSVARLLPAPPNGASSPPVHPGHLLDAVAEPDEVVILEAPLRRVELGFRGRFSLAPRPRGHHLFHSSVSVPLEMRFTVLEAFDPTEPDAPGGIVAATGMDWFEPGATYRLGGVVRPMHDPKSSDSRYRVFLRALFCTRM